MIHINDISGVQTTCLTVNNTTLQARLHCHRPPTWLRSESQKL